MRLFVVQDWSRAERHELMVLYFVIVTMHRWWSLARATEGAVVEETHCYPLYNFVLRAKIFRPRVIVLHDIAQALLPLHRKVDICIVKQVLLMR